MTSRGFFAMEVMHCIAAKLMTMFRRMLTASGETAMVSVAEVETMIDMSIEMFRPVEPWPHAEE